MIRQLTAASVCGGILALVTSGLVAAQLTALRSTIEVAAAPPVPAVASEVLVNTVEPASDSFPRESPGEGDKAVVEVTENPKSRVSESQRKRRGARPARPSHRAPDVLAQELVRGITELGVHRYEIRRRALDVALANVLALSRWIHVAPEVRDGHAVGFRLFAVAADGPFSKLGLRDGDVLVAINGLDITTPDHVLEAYGKLKTADHLSLRLLRGGRDLVNEYVIR